MRAAPLGPMERAARRALGGLLVAVALSQAGCAETVRCPDGQIFADDGACVPIPDAGADGGPPDGG